MELTIIRRVALAPCLSFILLFLFNGVGYSQTADSVVKPMRSVKEMPRFKGGAVALKKFFNKNIKIAKDQPKVSGDVVIEFVVKKDGTLSDFRISKSLNKEYDAEVLRVLSIAQEWTPGRHNGEIVEVYLILPFRFENGRYQ